MTMRTKYRKWVLLGAMLCSLDASVAIAGPQQDTELAEKEFTNGDLISAMALWRKAGQQGYAPAQARMGDMLDDAEDDKEAVEWYRKAVEQGSAAGEYGLGVMYLKGEGVGKDEEKARSFILRSANKNYVPAMRLMVEFYKAGATGLPLDLEQAGKWEDKMYAVTGQSKPVPKPNPEVEKKK